MKIEEVKPTLQLDKSNIVDYSAEIDWGDVSYVQFIVYQFDEDDKEYDEGDAIKYYNSKNPEEFVNIQRNAINYADRVAKKDSTPMTVVMIGYDENEEPMDEYWDTIYYVRPVGENPKEFTNQLKSIPENILTETKSLIESKIESGVPVEDSSVNVDTIFGNFTDGALWLSLEYQFWDLYNVKSSLPLMEFLKDVLNQKTDKLGHSLNKVAVLGYIMNTLKTVASTFSQKYIHADDIFDVYNGYPNIEVDIELYSSFTYDENWNSVYNEGDFKYTNFLYPPKTAHPYEEYQTIVNTYPKFRSGIVQGPDGNLYVASFVKRGREKIPVWEKIKSVHGRVKVITGFKNAKLKTNETLRLRIKESDEL